MTAMPDPMHMHVFPPRTATHMHRLIVPKKSKIDTGPGKGTQASDWLVGETSSHVTSFKAEPLVKPELNHVQSTELLLQSQNCTANKTSSKTLRAQTTQCLV